MNNLIYRAFLVILNVLISIENSKASDSISHSLNDCPLIENLGIVRVADVTPISPTLIHQLIHKLQDHERLIQILATTAYIPPDVLLAGGVNHRERLFRMVLCRRLSQLFGRAHLEIESAYSKDSLFLIGLKVTVKLGLAALKGLVPTLNGISDELVRAVTEGLKSVALDAAEEELKSTAETLLAEMCIGGQKALTDTTSEAFVFFTTFSSLDKASVLITNKISSIYREFIDNLTSDSITRLAESASEAIRYYIQENSSKKEGVDVRDIIDSVGLYYPVNKFRIQMHSSNPQRNGYSLEFEATATPRFSDKRYDLDVLLGSAIKVGGTVYCLKQKGGANYKFQSLGGIWKRGIVYTKVYNRYTQFQEGDKLLARHLDITSFDRVSRKYPNDSWKVYVPAATPPISLGNAKGVTPKITAAAPSSLSNAMKISETQGGGDNTLAEEEK